MKKLLIALLAGVGLSGCVAYPAGPGYGYYEAPGYYYGPSVSVGVGAGYGYRGGYRGDRHYR